MYLKLLVVTLTPISIKFHNTLELTHLSFLVGVHSFSKNQGASNVTRSKIHAGQAECEAPPYKMCSPGRAGAQNCIPLVYED